MCIIRVTIKTVCVLCEQGLQLDNALLSTALATLGQIANIAPASFDKARSDVLEFVQTRLLPADASSLANAKVRCILLSLSISFIVRPSVLP